MEARTSKFTSHVTTLDSKQRLTIPFSVAIYHRLQAAQSLLGLVAVTLSDPNPATFSTAEGVRLTPATLVEDPRLVAEEKSANTVGTV